jgi:hypothetical protein
MPANCHQHTKIIPSHMRDRETERHVNHIIIKSSLFKLNITPTLCHTTHRRFRKVAIYNAALCSGITYKTKL